MSTKRGTLQRAALVHGFFKGLAAPVLMYADHRLPPIPRFEPVSAPKTPLNKVLASDWRRIGADIDTVIERHVEATAEE